MKDWNEMLAWIVAKSAAFKAAGYQNYEAWAWNALPVSALIELAAVTLFAVNLFVTFLRPPVVVTTPLSMTTE